MAQTPIVEPEDDFPEQLRIRREKRAGLIERGVELQIVSLRKNSGVLRMEYPAAVQSN